MSKLSSIRLTSIRMICALGLLTAMAALWVADYRGGLRVNNGGEGFQLGPSVSRVTNDISTSQRLVSSPPLVVELTRFQGPPSHVQLCQATHGVLEGVDCDGCAPGCGEAHWGASRPIPWEVFAQGEYIGPARGQHVQDYYLRVDDILEVVYWFTLEARDEAYRFEVGDEIMVESLSDATLNRGDLNQGRGLVIQPDGTITVRLLGQIPAAGRTVDELRQNLEERYLEYYKVPSITVTPLKTNARLEALRSAIDARFGTGGQLRRVRIAPEGTIQLPGIGSTQANGLTMSELEREIEERYITEVGPGVNVTVSLAERAPRFVYVIGEVARPGQYPLLQPTTAIQALTLAGSWNNGANLREVVILRRKEDWRLMATKLDLRGALLGKRPCPADEIWLRDSDIVVVPKSPILLIDDFINLVFVRGIYGVVPFQGVSINFAGATSL